MQTKGVVIAGLGGGSGKSVVAVGLAALLVQQGKHVVPFKKGPDYIDAGWLALACKKNCFNLDPYLVDENVLVRSFLTHCQGEEIALIEGNRGLYDGVDVQGRYSTAELALLLQLPVILVINCAKMTRTVAALVLGCKELDPRLDIRGIILNNVATERQRALICEAIEQLTHIPVIGVIPRLQEDIFPMRHLGMIPYQEYGDTEGALSSLREVLEESLNVRQVTECLQDIRLPCLQEAGNDFIARESEYTSRSPVRIGVVRDSAFQFYYPENLEALKAEGASLVGVDALHDERLPPLDGIYIGGGFPETHAALLAANIGFRESVRQAAEDGLPLYAECGGLLYLGKSLEVAGKSYPMSGVFSVCFGMDERPQAHGYSIFKVQKTNPFYQVGDLVKGHEFRYSRVLEWHGSASDLVLQMQRGKGFSQGRDGLTYKNVLALYTHVHSSGTPQWASGFVTACRRERQRRRERMEEICM